MLDWVSAVGTVLAIAIAGYAGLMAQRSAAAAVDLVRVESRRDERDATEATWRQARRVALDLVAAPVIAPTPTETVVELRIWNTSSDPILKARIKVSVDGTTWGPQLGGTIGPGERATLTVVVPSATADDVNGYVYFRDVEGRPWLASARDPVEAAEGVVDKWIEDGRSFASTVSDPTTPDRYRGEYTTDSRSQR